MKYPLEVFFTFTTNCNLKCKHCYSNSVTEGKINDLHKLMKTLEEIHPLRVILSGGEPLIEGERLIDFLKKLRLKIDPYIVVATNATIFNEDNLMRLKPYIDRFQISLDTLSKEKFINIRGVDLLDKTIESIKLAKLMGFDIQIAFSIFKNNLDEIENIINFCELNKIDKINILRQRPLGRSKPDVSPKEVIEVYKKFLELSKDKNIKIIIHDPIANILGIESECTAAKDSIAIDINMNFKPCPLFDYTVSGDFKEIWNNDKVFKAIRKDIEDCKKCFIKNCNGGCKACSWNLQRKLTKDPWCAKDIKI